jgi:gliding motility-associated-like protein
VTNYGPPEITLPNVFTPNGDGTNDFWQFVTLTKAAEIEIQIVNRWGNLVFESSDLNFSWDGKILNRMDAVECVYFFKYTVLGLNGLSYEGHGKITLVRS